MTHCTFLALSQTLSQTQQIAVDPLGVDQHGNFTL